MANAAIIKPRLALCGFMAAGKSSLAAEISTHSGLEWADLDEDISQESGFRPWEIFRRHSELYFRMLERQALIRFVNNSCPILALGGGSMHYGGNSRLIYDHFGLVWVDCPIEIILTRLAENQGHGRPLYRQLGKDGLRKLYRARQPLYRQSRLRVDGRLPLCEQANFVLKNWKLACL